MKKLFQKRNLIIASAVLFMAALCTPLAFAQNSSAGVEFVQKLSTVLETGSVDEALNLYNQIPSELSEDTAIMCLKASLLMSADRDKEAQALASQLLAKEPQNVDVLDINVMLAKKRGDKASKTGFIKRILAIDPVNPGANIELADEQALKKNWRNARDYYKKALSGDPDNLDALFGYGKMCYYMEKDQDSKKAFNRLIELDPENPKGNAYLGKYAAENRQYRKAIDYVKIAIKYEPNNVDHYFDLGTYLRYIGDYEGAEKAWKKAVSLEPDYFLGYAYLAGLYDEENKTDLALDYYRLVVQKNPKYYYAYESLGMFAWKKGEWKDSMKAFQEALKKNPDSISYKLMICACMYKMGKIQEMRTFTEGLMKKLPDRNGLEYKFIRMYHDKGGDADVAANIQKETNRTKKGRYLFYLALYYQLTGKDSLAHKYYNEVVAMQSPMFFEYRMAQWESGGVN